jgi:hypothetical protein
MKNLTLVLLMTLLAFSGCDNSSSSNDKKGAGQPTTGNGSGTQTGNNSGTSDTTKPVELLPIDSNNCEQQPRFASHQFCTEYKVNKESYLKMVQFKPDCTFIATEYQMSNSQVISSHVGSWKAQGAYLTFNSATSGNAIRKITAWYGDGLDLTNPSETYQFCD